MSGRVGSWLAQWGDWGLGLVVEQWLVEQAQ